MSSRTHFVPMFVLLCISAIIVGCGDDEAIPNGADGGSGLVEGEYIATAVTDGDEPLVLVEGTTIRLRLDDRSLSARAGCNTIGGEFRIEDDVLHVDAISMTEIGCGQALHDQDEWLAGFLSSSPAMETVGDGFILRADTTEITFVGAAVAGPDVELVDTTWVVDGYVEGSDPDSAVSSTSDAGSFVFGTDGFVSGDDGCNSFGFAGEAGEPPTQGLRYEVHGEEIVFAGSAVITDKACPGRDVDRFWAVLSGTVSWQIDGSRLTLRGGAGRGVTYSAQS